MDKRKIEDLGPWGPPAIQNRGERGRFQRESKTTSMVIPEFPIDSSGR
jgi:hypothetical protein